MSKSEVNSVDQPEMKVTCDEVVVSGDWAHVIGNVTGKITSRTDNQPLAIKDSLGWIIAGLGTRIVAVQQQDGRR
jgi:hypothetical protein